MSRFLKERGCEVIRMTTSGADDIDEDSLARGRKVTRGRFLDGVARWC